MKQRTKSKIEKIDIVLLILASFFFGVPFGSGFILLVAIYRKHVRLFWINIFPILIINFSFAIGRFFIKISNTEFIFYNSLIILLLVIYNFVMLSWIVKD